MSNQLDLSRVHTHPAVLCDKPTERISEEPVEQRHVCDEMFGLVCRPLELWRIEGDDSGFVDCREAVAELYSSTNNQCARVIMFMYDAHTLSLSLSLSLCVQHS